MALKDKPIYYEVSSNAYSLKDDEAWAKEVKEKYVCPECRDFYPWVGAVPAVLASTPKRTSFGFTYPLGHNIASINFLSMIGDDLGEKDLYLGEVRNSQGELLKNYRTVRGREKVYMHGEKGSTLLICETCGKLRHFPMGLCYLMEASLGSGTLRRVYATQIALMVTADIAERLRNLKPKDFVMGKLRWRKKLVEGDLLAAGQGPILLGPKQSIDS